MSDQEVTVPSDLEEARKLNMLMHRWSRLNENEAFGSKEERRLMELRAILVPKYLPVVTALAQAGLLSYLFRVRGDGEEMLHHLQLACETAWVNGNIVLDGETTEGGSCPASDVFDDLLAELPKTKTAKKLAREEQ